MVDRKTHEKKIQPERSRYGIERTRAEGGGSQHLKNREHLHQRKMQGNQPRSYNISSFVYSFVIISIFAVSVGIVFFFAMFRGPEEVVVPNVERYSLSEAIVTLQERGMYANVQLRYVSDPRLKDHVISQQPIAGTVVKVGKTIMLTVSRGAVVETVKNYMGWKLSELRRELQRLYAGQSNPLFSIGEISYVYSSDEPGSILEQSPVPATPIVEATLLQLVVSKGKERVVKTVQNYLGVDYQDAIVSLAEQGLPLTFQLTNDDEADRGSIVEQSPSSGMFMNPGNVVNLIMVPPEPIEGQIFSLLRFELPQQMILANVSIVAQLQDGEEISIFTGKHYGGVFHFPYQGIPGTTLILYRYNVELERMLLLADGQGNDLIGE